MTTPGAATSGSAVTSQGPVTVPGPLRVAFWATVAGVLLSLVLFLKPGPYTVTVFMMVAQPLLLAGFALFVLQVYRDLRHRKIL